MSQSWDVRPVTDDINDLFCLYLRWWGWTLRSQTAPLPCPDWDILHHSETSQSSWAWRALRGSVGPQSTNSWMSQWSLAAVSGMKMEGSVWDKDWKKMQRARGERLPSLYFAFIGFYTMLFLGFNVWTF